jgi:hypothetical protein
MTIAFSLGNGQSRAAIDLDVLHKSGPIYACNAIYRNFSPDVLVATDRPIAQEIQNSGYSARHRFHTRRPIPGMGAQPVPKQYYGNSSGPIAVALAALDGKTKIYMLGFDLGPTLTGKFNNIYADTTHYKKSTDMPTYTGNWIKQIVSITKDFPEIQFIRVKGETTAEIPEFLSLPNLGHMQMDLFLERINNQKDL